MRIVFLALVSVLALAACGGDSGESTSPNTEPSPHEQCAGTFTWHYGSTPPPTSDHWTLTLHGDGTADYVHEASHVDEVVYEEQGFEVDEAAAQRVCETAADVPEDTNPRVGGQYVQWELSGMSGHTTQPDDAQLLLEAAREAVGQDRLDAGKAAFEEWQANYDG